ncbi:MAG: hypothetical protein LWX56_15385 [Ignavibacteria bacterium]|nr:hypothetical protein [Ignavibacteria bacterium]
MVKKDVNIREYPLTNDFIGFLEHRDLAGVVDTAYKALRDGVPYAEFFNLAGMLAFELRDLGQAKLLFEQGIDIEENPDCYFNLGLLHKHQKNYVQSARCLIKAKTLSPLDENISRQIISLYNEQFVSRYLSYGQSGKIGAIINFSALDGPFIDACIDNTLKVADVVVVAAFNQLFTGTDDSEGLQKIISRNMHKPVTFHVTDLPYTGKPQTSIYHNLTRIIGSELMRQQVDYVLFIDGDEIVDPEVFNAWKSTAVFDFVNVRFENYWYFREPVYQSTSVENSPLLINEAFLRFLLDMERGAIRHQTHDRSFYEFEIGRFISPPSFHHYSWVRTKEQMMEKVKNFGHNTDRDWVSLVEEEFTHGFTGKDFVHGYTYNVVENKFNITL